MSLHRRNPRRDANEAEIVEALQAQGFHVTRISGTGVPDLLVSKRFTTNPMARFANARLAFEERHCWLVEVKTPKGKPSKAQLAFRENWQGPPIITLRSVDDALRFPLLVCEGGQ